MMLPDTEWQTKLKDLRSIQEKAARYAQKKQQDKDKGKKIISSSLYYLKKNNQNQYQYNTLLDQRYLPYQILQQLSYKMTDSVISYQYHCKTCENFTPTFSKKLSYRHGLLLNHKLEAVERRLVKKDNFDFEIDEEFFS